MIVAAQDHVQSAFFLDRSRHNHLLDTALIKIGRQILHLQELSRALHDHFDSHTGKINLGKFLLLRKRDQFSVHGKTVVCFFHLLVPRAVHRIVLGQIGGRFTGTDIVHVNNLEARIVPRIAKDEATDATESVDSTLDHDEGRNEGRNGLYL